MTTDTANLTCGLCGSPADPELVELAEAFPRTVRADRCASCATQEREHAAGERREAAATQDLERRLAKVAAIIPPELARTSMAHPDFAAGIWIRLESWTPAEVSWLGVTGPPGTGKTRCLALLAKKLILAGIAVKWVPAVTLQERIEELARPKTAPAARAFLAACKSVAVLVIDDLGKQGWGAEFETRLFAIIDHRKTWDLPVLWTSNTSLRELAASGLLTKERGLPLLARIHEASRILTP